MIPQSLKKLFKTTVIFSLLLSSFGYISQDAKGINDLTDAEKAKLLLDSIRNNSQQKLLRAASIAGSKIAQKTLEKIINQGVQKLKIEDLVVGFLGKSAAGFGGVFAGALVGAVIPNPQQSELLERFDRVDAGINNILGRIEVSTAEIKNHIDLSFELDRLQNARNDLQKALYYFYDYENKNDINDLSVSKRLLRDSIENFKVIAEKGSDGGIFGLQTSQSALASVEKKLSLEARVTAFQAIKSSKKDALVAGKSIDILGPLRLLSSEAKNKTTNVISILQNNFENELKARVRIEKQNYFTGPSRWENWSCSILVDNEVFLTIEKKGPPNLEPRLSFKRPDFPNPNNLSGCEASLEMVNSYLRKIFTDSKINPQKEILKTWENFDFEAVLGYRVNGPLPDEAFTRKIIVSLPETFSMGEPVTALAEITNESIYEWDPKNGTYFGFFVAQIPGGENRQETRMPEPEIVFPGQTVQIKQTFTIGAPGTYQMHLDLLQEGVTWAHWTHAGKFEMPKFTCSNSDRKCRKID